AFNASEQGGILVVFGASPHGPGTIFFVIGTSQGPPAWAGIVALADQAGGHRLGGINQALYRIARGGLYGRAFHDITTGNNSFAGVTGFAAARGWDPVTGLGTPDVARLAPLLARGDRSGS
ncbi:MAG TPA: protease, partial [Candidatus Dormibacteraeota bacterium]